LPEPESPITTNTSPGHTSNETSRTAATQPVLARSSLRDSSASGVPTIEPAFGPNTFHTPSARISGSPLWSTRGFPVCVASLIAGCPGHRARR
jgi:hypothetical protein